MSVKEDFDISTAAALEAELEQFGGESWYDAQRKKIVYCSPQAALHAYMLLQAREMERHKWIESQKAHCDLKELSLADWVKHHSIRFHEYWQRTHVFIPAAPQVAAI